MQDEYVRDMLRFALSDLQATQKGQLAIMGETAAGDSFTSKPLRTVEMGGNAIQVESEAVTYREGKKYKQNKPLILEGTFRTVIWRQAVNKLSELHQSWAKYCYGNDLNYGHQIIICQAVWERFTKSAAENGLKKMAGKTLQKVRALVWLSVQASLAKINEIGKQYSSSELSALLGIARNNWQDNYLPRWALLLATCEALDLEALAHAGRQHRAEFNRRRSPAMPLQKADAKRAALGKAALLER